jgi:hypothetical protein
VGRALEGGDVTLQRLARRVLGASILVTGVVPDRILTVRRRLEHRGHHRAGSRLGFLSGMHAVGAEAHGITPRGYERRSVGRVPAQAIGR